MWAKIYTVKLVPVYKDHPRDQQNMVLIHRWSLYAGSITLQVYAWGPAKCGLYKQVVFIYRWSLEPGALYLQMVSRAGLTVVFKSHACVATVHYDRCKKHRHMYM